MSGHEVRRWNYPAGYRVPARMPDKVRREIKAMEADSTAQSPVPALARELEARCRDFCRISKLYDTSHDDTDPAHTYWPEAYLGVIEVADWLRMESTGATFRWASQIFPSEMKRMLHGLPSGEGLSEGFQALLVDLEDRLTRVARTSHNEIVLFEHLPGGERMPELQTGMCLAAGQSLNNLDEVFERARDDFPLTRADRLLKMRIIEIEYGPSLMLRLHARQTMHLHSHGNLVDVRDLRQMQYDKRTRMKPRRLDHKEWSWIYRKAPNGYEQRR